MNPTRREVLVGAAAVGATAMVPVSALASAAPALDGDYLGVFVRGCGSACDCSSYLRTDCAWGRLVRKLGDKYIVYDQDNKIVGEAEHGFKPLPEDAEWVAKVEYSEANNLPHPYGWSKEKHAEWPIRPERQY